MIRSFTLSDFLRLFPTDESCLEEIKKLRFQNGIYCLLCGKKTAHYKVTHRQAYSCAYCRHHVFPLAGTIFEKTTTPLRLWFFAMFLMTLSRATISIRDLQTELHVTYKTAWRMHKSIKMLMAQNNGDLLTHPEKVIRWNIFNTFEFKVVQKQEASR